ncbi:MAG: amino acid permease [Myxococcota bacterium]|nr:amino acid permease [Myxococcota bacterium]
MTAPVRQLGLIVTAAIVVANMIGTGVFTSTGFQAASLHDPQTILLCWVVGGVVALCGAATYAELGSMMPKAGGEYVYLREAYHPAVGFMSGWVSLTAGFSAPIAVAALAFSRYLGTLIPAVGGAPWWSASIDLGFVDFMVRIGPAQGVAMVLILALAALHSFDAKIGGWVQAAFTAAKVLLIVLFILGGLLLGKGDWSNFASRDGGFDNVTTTAFATSLMYVSFAYSGWNAAAYIAGEVRQPDRTIPRALLLGTGSVIILYVLLNLVFLYAVPAPQLASGAGGGPVFEVGDVAARALFGNSAGQLVTSVIALALVSAVSAMVMAGPRVYAAMARDHALPRQLAHHNKRGVPVTAVITQGVLGCLFVLVGDPEKLIRFVGFTLAVFAGLAVAAVFILRARGFTSAYRTTGYPITPLLFIALSVWIAYAQIKDRPVEAAAVGIVLGVGALVYWFTIGRKPPVDPDAEPAAGPVAIPEARVVSDDRA